MTPGFALLPTLVFSLVLLGILQERFAIAGPLVGGLVVYTLLGTLLPGFLLRRQARESGVEQGPGSTSVAA